MGQNDLSKMRQESNLLYLIIATYINFIVVLNLLFLPLLALCLLLINFGLIVYAFKKSERQHTKKLVVSSILTTALFFFVLLLLLV